MARAVRKVSRTSTKNQKKESSINKKWIIIISAILVVLIGLGVGLGVYFGTRTEEVYVSDKIYFTEATKTTDGEHEVEFTKENYQTISRYIKKGNDINHIFIFTYNGSAFYADEEDEDNYNEDYVTLITRLADLQYQVDLAKKSGVIIDFYIVDTSVDNQVNSGILTDATYGNLGSSSVAFIYLHEGEFMDKLEDTDKSMISTSDLNDILSTTINNAINYIKSLND